MANSGRRVEGEEKSKEKKFRLSSFASMRSNLSMMMMKGKHNEAAFFLLC